MLIIFYNYLLWNLRISYKNSFNFSFKIWCWFFPRKEFNCRRRKNLFCVFNENGDRQNLFQYLPKIIFESAQIG